MNLGIRILEEHPELLEFFQVVRYALERCVPLVESKLVGIARYMGAKHIKRGSHLRRIAKTFSSLIQRRGMVYALTNAGRYYLTYVIRHPYLFIPLQLRIQKMSSNIDSRYYLDGYFIERNNKREAFTMIYTAKILFLRDGETVRSPVEANDVVALIRHINKSCRVVFNPDESLKVEAYPNIAYLFWYVALRIDAVRDTNLKYLAAKFPHKVFSRIEKITDLDTELWKIETPYGNVMICPRCISNKCHHIKNKIRHMDGITQNTLHDHLNN